ncbi:hypothetical protein Tco_0374603 [Tanacetum coccineum]
MAIPEDHLAKFHKMADAKEMWNAIKSRFGGNDESKKMQKYILKQQFEGFTVSNTDGIHKGYERFQKSSHQLENSRSRFLNYEETNQHHLQLQNVAFISENTNGTNDVSTAHGVSNTFGHNSKLEHTSSYSLLASQSSCPQLDHEDLDQVDKYDLEKMDLKWQVAMISMRIKKFYKKTGTKEDNRKRDGWNPVNKDGSRTGKKEESKAMVTVDGESVDWTTHSENNEDYHLLQHSGSNTRNFLFNECKESMLNVTLKDYNEPRESNLVSSVEIKAYTQGLKKVEAQLVAHQQGQLWYEQKIKFMKIDLDDKTDVLTYHKKLLAKAQKEKDDLEVIVDKWNHSSKNLGKIVNHHMSARDKFGLGYGDYRYSGNLSYENEVFQSVFKSNKGDFENPPLQKTCEMQAVPPPMTGNYLPSGPDIEIDDSQYTYGPEKTQPNSDYAGANLDRKSTTGGCHFLGRRLITWQCKKQTIVATSTTEAEYVAAASCCGQVLWIQNQMLDYGFNFMNTKIYIDNESTICIVKNPVYHSKTKHIAIRHHFIRDAYEEKLIQVLKIHTNDNVADLLTKAFDVSRFQFLVVSIGMINP